MQIWKKQNIVWMIGYNKFECSQEIRRLRNRLRGLF